MAYHKFQDLTNNNDTPLESTSPSHDELTQNYSDLESEELDEKESTELELEKLVFGDDEGFRASLSAHQRVLTPNDSKIDGKESRNIWAASDAEEGFEAVADADVRLNVLSL